MPFLVRIISHIAIYNRMKRTINPCNMDSRSWLKINTSHTSQNHATNLSVDHFHYHDLAVCTESNPQWSYSWVWSTGLDVYRQCFGFLLLWSLSPLSNSFWFSQWSSSHLKCSHCNLLLNSTYKLYAGMKDVWNHVAIYVFQNKLHFNNQQKMLVAYNTRKYYHQLILG